MFAGIPFIVNKWLKWIGWIAVFLGIQGIAIAAGPEIKNRYMDISEILNSTESCEE